jgi:hypothetical protein
MAERHATHKDDARVGKRLQLENELKARQLQDADAARHDDDLQICPECGRDLVIPIDWAPGEPGYWQVTLRCPDCEWRGSGTYHQTVVDRFDEALDEGTQALLDDLRILSRANVEEEIERFAEALRYDLILPEDF